MTFTMMMIRMWSRHMEVVRTVTEICAHPVPFVNCHGNGACQEGDPVTVAVLNPDVGVVVGKCTVARIGHVWEEILVTVDGFGAAICNKCTQSQGFGLSGTGPGRRGDTIWEGGGGGSVNCDHICACLRIDQKNRKLVN